MVDGLELFMGLWLRVFGRGTAAVTSDAIREHLANRGITVACDFAGAGENWSRAEFRLSTTTPVMLEHFRVDEEGIRAELNSWAAFLETCDYEPNHVVLMERVIQSKQLFTLRRPIDCANEVLVDNLCVDLCRFLAGATDGVWQCDDEGFFAADGTVLLKEY
jgi:hypothetical protein